MQKAVAAGSVLSERVFVSGKQFFNQNKDIAKKFKGSSNDGRSRLIDEDEGGYQVQDDSGEGGGRDEANIYSYEAGAGTTARNKVLTSLEQCRCCGCAKRWQLAILANLGFIIVFGIRCNFGAARNAMTKGWTDPKTGRNVSAEFTWSISEKGWMESAFFYGYIITQLPGGFLAAKFPPNKLFGLAIGSASFLNLFMPAALQGGYFGTGIIQMLQGVVQGVSYPAMHGCWRYWAPPLERSKLATTAFTGSYAGAVIGLPMSAMLVSYLAWEAPFYFYGVCGILWTLMWYCLIFEKPAFHPTISEDEKQYIENAIGHVSHSTMKLSNIPWKAILTSKPVWAIVVANFARSWTFYLLLNHQLTYMREVLHMDMSESGFLAALPHAVMAVMVLVGGQLADYLRAANIMSTTNVRKVFNCGGFGGEAVFLLMVGYSGSNRTAATIGLILAVGSSGFAISGFGGEAVFLLMVGYSGSNRTAATIGLILAVDSSGFAISGFNVNHLDIAPRYASLLMGISNGVGTFSGMICPVVTERLKGKYGPAGWETIFLLASLIHFTGVIFYAIFASGDLQDWAEPPPEEESWQPDDFAAKASNAGLSGGGYGATAPVDIAPIPDVAAIRGAPNAVANHNYADYQDLS